MSAISPPRRALPTVDAPVEVVVAGHAGFYCGGMNKQADIIVEGHAGPGVAENMVSGPVRVKSNASQMAGASGHGGLLVIERDASSRCGISMKGINIVVVGSIGHMGAFMAQTGHLVVCGDAGSGLGDSIYEATLFVRGAIDGLGADCTEKEMRPEHVEILRGLLAMAELDADAGAFRRYGSARKLYHYDVDHADVGAAGMATDHDGGLRTSAVFPRTVIHEFQRAADEDVYEIRGFGAKRSVPSFDDLLLLGASMSRYPFEGYRERCGTDVVLGARHAEKPVALKIPIAIAGMSFGSLGARAKEALGRGASAMGTTSSAASCIRWRRRAPSSPRRPSRAPPGRRTRSPTAATTAPTWCASRPGRFELRLMDGVANPYLAQAGILVAGLDGIANKRDPGKRRDINMYTEGTNLRGVKRLPLTLLDALRLLEKNRVIRDGFGKEVVDSYFILKMRERRRLGPPIPP